MPTDLDLIVIGSGSAARSVAYPCRKAGWKVAVIESGPFGGTCALRGCDPKKVLVGAAELVDWQQNMQQHGVHGESRIHWPDLMAFKRTFTDSFPAEMQHQLAESGIEAITGVASFTAANTIQVGDRRLSARHIVIATGARPSALKIPGEHLAITSEGFLNLNDLPKRIVFIGGGYIGFEFAHIAARAGADAIILHRGSRPLENFDADLVNRLCDHTRALGVDIRVNTHVAGIERAGDGFTVRVETKGSPGTVEADLVIHAAGREPNLADLHLERGGVDYDAHGVTVNSYMQSTTNPQVWAAGDASGMKAPRLTPVSANQGAIVTHNLLHDSRRTFDPGPIPSVVFTVPPLASVGQSAPAKVFDTSHWYTSRRLGEPCSASKVVVDPATDQILGAHLLGHGAEDVINIFAVAMRCKMPSSELKEMLFAYPTKTSDIEYLL